MLVLSRKQGETIIIGEDVKVVVVAIRGDKVRVGVDADPKISVDRLEVRKAKKQERGAP